MRSNSMSELPYNASVKDLARHKCEMNRKWKYSHQVPPRTRCIPHLPKHKCLAVDQSYERHGMARGRGEDPPSLSGLNEIHATDHTNFLPWQIPGTDGAALIFVLNWRRKKKVTPWSQWVWGPCCQQQWEAHDCILAGNLHS